MQESESRLLRISEIQIGEIFQQTIKTAGIHLIMMEVVLLQMLILRQEVILFLKMLRQGGFSPVVLPEIIQVERIVRIFESVLMQMDSIRKAEELR